jgi:hypothetical protein
MPKKPESLLYERLRENLSNCLLTRIESWVNQGIPDALLAFRNGAFVPVELKVVTRGRKVPMRPHQVSFHMRHAANGNDTFVLVEYRPPRDSKKEPRLMLYRGDQAADLMLHGLDVAPLAEWHGDAVMWRMLAMHLDGGR